MTLTNQGSMHIPLLVGLSILSMCGFGTWGLLRQWRHLSELQIQLDECAGKTALEFRRTLNRIDFLDNTIAVLRVSLAVSTIDPPGRASLQALLEAAVTAQNVVIDLWQAKSMLASLPFAGCSGATFESVPGIPWHRGPPDLLGSPPLRPNRISAKPEAFRIEANHHPRAAAAEVKEVGSGLSKKWTAKWVIPRKIPLPAWAGSS